MHNVNKHSDTTLLARLNDPCTVNQLSEERTKNTGVNEPTEGTFETPFSSQGENKYNHPTLLACLNDP